MDRAMDHVAGCVDPVIGVRLPDDVAFEVDLDEARRRDLLVEQPVEIDQQMIVAAGNARGDVVVDEVGHPIGIDQAVARREIEPGLPFVGRYLVADALEVGRIFHGFGRRRTEDGRQITEDGAATIDGSRIV
jgi:hypothetical protein